MVIIEKIKKEDVLDVKAFEDIVYNATDSSTVVKLFNIPIWKSSMEIRIPSKHSNKDKKIGFNADKT